jgi:hypothetical protein
VRVAPIALRKHVRQRTQASVWLVMHQEVRSNARIRRVDDFLAATLGELLRNA